MELLPTRPQASDHSTTSYCPLNLKVLPIQPQTSAHSTPNFCPLNLKVLPIQPQASDDLTSNFCPLNPKLQASSSFYIKLLPTLPQLSLSIKLPKLISIQPHPTTIPILPIAALNKRNKLEIYDILVKL
jgi:hypothetical protein